MTYVNQANLRGDQIFFTDDDDYIEKGHFIELLDKPDADIATNKGAPYAYLSTLAISCIVVLFAVMIFRHIFKTMYRKPEKFATVA